MPSKNSRRAYEPHSFYHIYNRGVEKRTIFLDGQDYAVFLSYLRRHLVKDLEFDGRERPYVYCNNIELVAYCLMPNHFHILVYVSEIPIQVATFMQAVCTAYSRYFNKRYRRKGHLFQGRFKSVLVNKDDYLQHISRYIHLNPDDYMDWEWSSVRYYLGLKPPVWLKPERILMNFASDYKAFLDDYIERKRYIEEAKKSLENFE